MPSSPRQSKENSRLITLLVVVAVLALLYVGREVLIPMALAVLLSFLLAPLCNRLERWKLGRVASVIIVTLLSFSVAGAVGWIVAGQIIELAGEMPRYQYNIGQKIKAVKLSGAGPLSRATKSIKELTQELLAVPESGDPDVPSAPSPEDAVPVQIVQDPYEPMTAIRDVVGPLWNPLVSAGIVIVFVIFMLLQRDDLRDRILRLIGQGRMTVATQAIDDAAQRVSRYLLMQLIINATYGLAAGIGLYFIGVPNALLWGVFATLLRFIPYIGPWLGALFPLVLSLAAFETWTPFMLTIGLFIVIELISNNVMEPWLYGSRTGISPVAIIVSAVFWAWLWGPVGLMLATPMTVCVVVMGRYIPRLEFLNVLFSDEPGLSPAARLYQRLLAMDEDDAFEIAETYLQEHSLVKLYDDIFLPSLQIAERDRHNGRLGEEHEQTVYQIIREMVNELGERPPTLAEEKDKDDKSEEAPAQTIEATAIATDSPSTPVRTPRVLCVPAQDAADELSSVMLTQVLKANSITAQSTTMNGLLAELIEQIKVYRPDVLCICGVPPQGVVRLRTLCKRFSWHFPEMKIVVGYWGVADLASTRQKVKSCRPERVVSSLGQALSHLRG